MLRFNTNNISPDASLLVAFSGGLDSTALLHYLAGQGKHKLRALHVHHGLHADADQWAEHCQQFAKKLNIECLVVRVELRELINKHGVEGAARAARYQVFAEHLQNDEVLVTAHHQDDQAETVLLRLLRGSGSEGLSAMQAWRDFAHTQHWRPLLDIPRSEIEHYAAEHGLQYLNDPANDALNFDRNYLRHEILPRLQQRWPQTAQSLAQSAALLGNDAEWLQHETTKLLAACQGLNDDTLHVSSLLDCPAHQRSYILRTWAEQNDAIALDSQAITTIEHELLQAREDSEASLRWQQHKIYRWRDLLYIEPITPDLPNDYEAQWNAIKALSLPTQRTLSLNNNANVHHFVIRGRKGGEKIQLPNREHRHEVKKLFQEFDVAPWERERLPFIYSIDNELVAVGDILRSATAEKMQWFFRLEA